MTPINNWRPGFRAGLRAGGLSGSGLSSAMQGAGTGSFAEARQGFRASGLSGDALHGAMRNFRQAGAPGGGMGPTGGPEPLSPIPPGPGQPGGAPMGTPPWMKEFFTTQTTGVNEPQPTGMGQTPLFNVFGGKGDNALASLPQNFNPTMGGFTPTDRYQRPEDFYKAMWEGMGGGYQKHLQKTYQDDPWLKFLSGGGSGEGGMPGKTLPTRPQRPGGHPSEWLRGGGSSFGALR